MEPLVYTYGGNVSLITPLGLIIKGIFLELIGINLPFHPGRFHCCTLGIIEQDIRYFWPGQLIDGYFFTNQKNWKPATIPTVSEWSAKMHYTFLMCKLTAVSKYTIGPLANHRNILKTVMLY